MKPEHLLWEEQQELKEKALICFVGFLFYGEFFCLFVFSNKASSES